MTNYYDFIKNLLTVKNTEFFLLGNNMVEMNRISTCKKSVSGEAVTSKSAQTTYTKRTIEGNGMYTFVYGKGNKKVSETKHMSTVQADNYKKQLESAGY